jgi:hypothetical protein
MEQEQWIKRQDENARAAARRYYVNAPSSILVADWADICEADGKFFAKRDARIVGGATYCEAHALAFFADQAAMHKAGR